MPTVKAMTITVDRFLSRSKLDCDVGYDAAVKGVECSSVKLNLPAVLCFVLFLLPLLTDSYDMVYIYTMNRCYIPQSQLTMKALPAHLLCLPQKAAGLVYR